MKYVNLLSDLIYPFVKKTKDEISFPDMVYPYMKRWFEYIGWISITGALLATYLETKIAIMLVVSWLCWIFLLGYTHIFFMDNIVYKIFSYNWVKKNKVGIVVILLSVLFSGVLTYSVSLAITSLIKGDICVK